MNFLSCEGLSKNNNSFILDASRKILFDWEPYFETNSLDLFAFVHLVREGVDFEAAL